MASSLGAAVLARSASEGVRVFEGYYRRRFTELGEPLTESDGLGDAAVAAALAGRRLVVPVALSSYYAVAGRHGINRQHNRLYPVGELVWEGDRLVFMEENQCVAFWAIARSDAESPDPMVWQAPNAEPSVWFTEPYRVRRFLMAMWRWQLTGEQEAADAPADPPGAAGH